jgi:DNA-binding NarL/FixJ family response regulator
VLVVDDHPMVREGLRSMLRAPEIEVVGEGASAADATRLARELRPDVVLLDVQLQDGDGVSALAEIARATPRPPVLVVTMHDDPRLVRRAVDAGAAGYVLKGIGRRELLAAIRAVRDGESVLDPAVLRALVRAEAAPAGGLQEPLSAIERDVVRLIADGLTNRQIAVRLRWSVATAKKYVQRILDKLEVSDRTQAAVTALRRGLL